MSYAPHAKGLLAPMAPYLESNDVSDIILNRPGSLFIERRGRFEQALLPEFDITHCRALGQMLAAESFQVFNPSIPLMSSNLYDGSRIQCVLPPCAAFPGFVIRRAQQHTLSLDQINTQSPANEKCEQQLPINLQHAYQQQKWNEFLRLAIKAKLTIVFSGATASGKTTLMNSCIDHINPNSRLLILEDTREIRARHLNQMQLLTQAQTTPPLTLRSLIECSLRLRPDRLLIGEIRGPEIREFINACLTGHSGSMTTIHAGSTQEALTRMVHLYKLNSMTGISDASIMQEIHQAIDVIVQCRRRSDHYYVEEVYYQP